METGSFSGGATLTDGAYLYTALVHFHRSTGARTRGQTSSYFQGIPLNNNIRPVMGRNAGNISRGYFSGAVSPHDVLRRHTLFGYFNLRYDIDFSVVAETKLIEGFFGDRVRFDPSVACKYLRWCPRCSDEEFEAYGFASWKTVHQIRSIHVCHIHGNLLLLRCKQCGGYPGDWRKFRLPGESCPYCRSSEFEGSSIDAGTAYQQFVQDVAAAFSYQTNIYRGKKWATLIATFVSRFNSLSDAENALSNYLFSKWKVPCLAALGDLLQVRVGSTSRLFDIGTKSMCFRILLYRAMITLSPDMLREDLAVSVPSIARSGTLFASTAGRHAVLVGIDEVTQAALIAPGSIKDAAASMGLDYDSTYRKWKRLLNSMLAELGEEAVREMLPDGRRFHRVTRVGRGQDLMAAYKHRISTVLQENPTHTRVSLWREHFRAMKYLSVNDYDWLANLVGWNRLSKHPIK
ncbi:TniQ family protein [Acidovorax kalamii]|uniref:TniQ family protein n=1 Tax=Acidovorax kalamii TaxID=2004485 RepID=UPI002090CBC7|nr:TniQ family protein [Acidovorax kalamii]MCO5357774.1 TniQ family protein [Acidovorax kalamii]